MDFENYQEYQIDYPAIPIEMVEGSILNIYTREKFCFIPFRCLVDNLGNYLIIERDEDNCIDFSQVSDVRKNFFNKDDSVKFDTEDLSLIFTLVYGPTIVQVKYVHFKFDNKQLFDLWYENMSKLIRSRIYTNPSLIYMLQRDYHRMLGIAKCVGKLSVSQLALYISSSKSYEDFIKCAISLELVADSESQNIRLSQFTFNKYLDVYTHMCPRPDLDTCFKDQTSSKVMIMTMKEFNQFRVNCQKEDIKREEFSIYKIEHDKNLIEREKLSFNGFSNYLFSDNSKIINDSYYETAHDLTKPLPHYLIYSSHNTYLTGFQIYSTSSVEIYRQCLLKGCRSVEIDCWDGPNLEPMVTHGYAMCSIVPFKDVVLAIKESAFVNSKLPVIISIENHCSSKLQRKMAQYFIEILGDLLLTEELATHPIIDNSFFPSPQDLKNKIILKAKYESSPTEKKIVTNKNSIEDLEAIAKVEEVSLIKHKLTKDSTQKSFNSAENEQIMNVLADSVDQININEIPEPLETETHLKSIINYGRAFPFPDLTNVADDPNHIKIVSISETTGEKHAREKGSEFLDFNTKSLTRIYPRSSRIDSSNYNPIFFWNIGCQLVALNIQTPDIFQQLNHARFMENIGQGYVLKPDILIERRKDLNLMSSNLIEDTVPFRLRINIISAQFVYEKSNETVACVETFGLPSDQYFFRVKLSKILQENIIFEQNELVIEKILMPNLAYIRFSLIDEFGACLYQRVLPVAAIKNGYRHIPLKNRFDRMASLTTMFIKINFDQFTPEAFEDFESSLVNPLDNDVFENSKNENAKISTLFLNKTDVYFPSLSLPTEDEIRKNVNEIIIEAQKVSTCPKESHKIKKSISTRYKLKSKDQNKMKRTKTHDVIFNFDDFLTIALEIARQIQKNRLEDLQVHQKQDLNVLLKILTEEFMHEQKKIKADPSLNKDQKEQKLKAHRQSFVETCASKKQQMISKQQKAFCDLIQIHSKEMEILKNTVRDMNL